MSSMRDPYLVLGLTSRSVSQEEIKKAYHKLAKLYHPDRHQGDKKNEAKFKEVNAAYDIIGDKEKRARFDRGEIDAAGREQDTFGSGGYQRSYTHSQRPRGAGARSFFDADDFSTEDIINDIFGGMRRGRNQRQQEEPLKPGKDISYTLKLPFIEATMGGKRSIQLAGGKEVSLTIPPGTVDGTKLRLKGQGISARSGGPTGDAYITINVEPHKLFKRDGNDIHVEVPVNLQEAVLGATIRVPTLSGLVDVKVPKNSNTGTILRLKGKGVPLAEGPGDQYVRLKLMLPDQPDDSLIGFLKEWSSASGFNPRKKAGLE